MTKMSIHQGDKTIVNIYIPQNKVPKYIKQILTELKRKINSNIIIVGDFSTALSTKDKPDSESIRKQQLKQHHRPNSFSTHIQNLPSQQQNIH